MAQQKICTIIGTRPEAIKMAPVILELRRHNSLFEHVLVGTAQHREMLDQALSQFSISLDIDLGLMELNQSLAEFASRSLVTLSELFSKVRPHMVLLQGDTTTVMTAALSAFFQGIQVSHVEAGLRTYDSRNPFPEEVNRRIVSSVTDLHFAPTDRARLNLLHEGVSEQVVYVTGNTVLDALRLIPVKGPFENQALQWLDWTGRRVLLVTAHRRESHGQPLRSICRALKTLIDLFPDMEIVYPVHLNPHVLTVVQEELSGIPRIHLLEPVSYLDLLRIVERCFLILTDSGGIQEEAPSFHKPVLILRQRTERPELVEVGGGKLVGTDPDRIVMEASRLLNEPGEYERMREAKNPFGDGHAAERIVSILAQRLGQ
jgi:UDP-N-acetylglucosamine 2-epimerase (non-hydrolysing)